MLYYCSAFLIENSPKILTAGSATWVRIFDISTVEPLNSVTLNWVTNGTVSVLLRMQSGVRVEASLRSIMYVTCSSSQSLVILLLI